MRLTPSDKPQLVLLRHGQTEWSATGRHTGRTDIALLPEGQEQARIAGAALADFNFGAVYASPLQRAQHTAHLAGFPDPILDDNLMEWDYGPVEGRTPDEISEALGREFLIFSDGIHVIDDGWAAARPDDVVRGPGEDLSDVAHRAQVFMVTAEQTLNKGQDVLVVAHGHFLRVLGAVWLGLTPQWAARLELDTAAICLLGYGHHLRTIEGWNLPPSS